MGRNKLLFDVAGEPLVRRVVRSAAAAGLDPIVVVLGHEPEAVRGALARLSCEYVLNPRHGDGMKSSVCAGVAALPPDVAAAIVLLSDMPFVIPAMLQGLAERHRDGDALLILSEYDGVHAPPTLIDRSLFGELMAEPVRGCSKRLRARHPDETAAIGWPATALADVDLPVDYERVKATLAAT